MILSEMKTDKNRVFLFIGSPAKTFLRTNRTPELFQMSVVVGNRLMCKFYSFYSSSELEVL